MNEQGARITASGKLDEKFVTGKYVRSNRSLMLAFRKLKAMCGGGKDISEIGHDGILLDKVMTELRRRGIKDLAKRGIN